MKRFFEMVFDYGTVLASRQDFALEDAIAFHAFALLETLPCI